jgi:hypothetical protein
VVGILVYYLWSGPMDFVPPKIAVVTGAAVITFSYLTQFNNPLWVNLLWWWPAWPYFLAPLVVAGALLMKRRWRHLAQRTPTFCRCC